MSNSDMKCGNQFCVNGLEPVMVLDSTPQEIYILAEHLPRSKSHMHREMWPCRYCNPRWYAKFKHDHENRTAVNSGAEHT